MKECTSWLVELKVDEYILVRVDEAYDQADAISQAKESYEFGQFLKEEVSVVSAREEE